MSWEFKWKSEDVELHGPHTSQKMLDWQVEELIDGPNLIYILIPFLPFNGLLIFVLSLRRSLASLTRGFSSEKLAQRNSGIQRGLILSFMFSQLSGLQSFLQVGNIMHLLKR